MSEITQEYLKSRIRYDSETGHFYWIDCKSTWRNGARAGCYNSAGGYVMITIDGGKYLGHRLAWLYVHGYMPDEIDHKNRVRNNNRISNLRECTRSQNMANKADRVNASGLPRGVTPHRRRFKAHTHCNSKYVYIGLFKTPEEAGKAARAKRIELHGL